MNFMMKVETTGNRIVSKTDAAKDRKNALTVVRDVETTLAQADEWNDKLCKEIMDKVSHNPSEEYNPAADEAVVSLVNLVLDNRNLPHVNGKTVAIAGSVWAKVHPSDVSRKQMWHIGGAAFGVLHAE